MEILSSIVGGYCFNYFDNGINFPLADKSAYISIYKIKSK